MGYISALFIITPLLSIPAKISTWVLVDSQGTSVEAHFYHDQHLL